MPYGTGKDIVRNCKCFFFGPFTICQCLESEKKHFLLWEIFEKVSQWLVMCAPLQGGTVLSIQKSISFEWKTMLEGGKNNQTHNSVQFLSRNTSEIFSHDNDLKHLSLISNVITNKRQKSNYVFSIFHLLYMHYERLMQINNCTGVCWKSRLQLFRSNYSCLNSSMFMRNICYITVSLMCSGHQKLCRHK